MGGDETPHKDLSTCVRSVEAILKYKFRNTKLLEDALTHSSFPEPTSFQRLEFLGDSVLGLAVANFVFLTYPSLDPGQLTDLRNLNVDTHKFARVAVRHGFHRFVRHACPTVDKIHDFVLAVMEEEETLPCRAVRAPKILADVVEAIAGAVYIDCGFDLKALWLVFRGLLEPIVTLEDLQEYERPLTALKELCRAQGKPVAIKHWKVDSDHFCSIYVDGEVVASATSHQLGTAKLSAAREALGALARANASGGGTCGFTLEVDGGNEVVAAKLKLSDICVKQKWPEPSYRVEKEEGQCDVKKYVCSVHVEVEKAVLVMHGDEQSTVEDAENSAASFMICSLIARGLVLRERRRKRRRSSSTNLSSKDNDKDVSDETKTS